MLVPAGGEWMFSQACWLFVLLLPTRGQGPLVERWRDGKLVNGCDNAAHD